MVGVPRSTGCLICRKRKIKCDETWPNCISCQKNGKLCPGPPSRHTFRSSSSNKSASCSVELNCASDDRQCIDSPAGREITFKKRLTKVGETRSENGAVILKFRMSDVQSTEEILRSPRSNTGLPHPILRKPPSPSWQQKLAQSLVEAIMLGDVGYSLADFGSFVHEIPKRIGQNIALDAAVACLVHAQSSHLHNKGQLEVDCPKLYLPAVQALQICLGDPKHSMSANTLCASVLLGLVEVLAGPRMNNRFLAHVGGAGRLLEIRGPLNCQDFFSKDMLYFSRGGVIITSIFKQESCFLTLPSWRDIAFDVMGLDADDCAYTGVLQCMASFSALLTDFKGLEQYNPLGNAPDFTYMDDLISENPGNHTSSHFSPTTSGLNLNSKQSFYYPANLLTIHSVENSAHIVLNELYALKDSLSIPGAFLTSNLSSGRSAVELPSLFSHNPLSTSYHFAHWRRTAVYINYWMLTILINRCLLKVMPLWNPAAYILDAECRSLALEICKTWEDSWARRPMGVLHVNKSFVVAYDFCDEEVKLWILKCLNELLSEQGVTDWKWNEGLVKMMSRKLAGEGEPLMFSDVT